MGVHRRALLNRLDTRHLRDLLADWNPATGDAATRQALTVARLSQVADTPPGPWRWPRLEIRNRETPQH